MPPREPRGQGQAQSRARAQRATARAVRGIRSENARAAAEDRKPKHIRILPSNLTASEIRGKAFAEVVKSGTYARMTDKERGEAWGRNDTEFWKSYKENR